MNKIIPTFKSVCRYASLEISSMVKSQTAFYHHLPSQKYAKKLLTRICNDVDLSREFLIIHQVLQLQDA